MDHTIIASAGQYGMISPSGAIVVPDGENKTFTIAPYAGFVLGDSLVDNASIGAVSTYTFVNVIVGHTIVAAFNPISFNIPQFRLDFPEFADTTKYPDSMIIFWMGLGDVQLNRRRWGNRRIYGLSLFVAHNISLAGLNSATGLAGAMPGIGFGLVTSESAGPLSYSVDVQSAIEERPGHWALTVYGSMYLRLTRMVGIAGLQV